MTEMKEEFCLAPLPETQRGYGRLLYAANYKGQDRIIYTCGRHVIMRDLKDPRVAEVFSEHKDKVNVAAFSPNGNWVASGDSTGRVKVWGTSNMIIKNEVAVCNSVNDITWGPDSKKLCAVGAGSGNLAKVFNYDSSNALGNITGHAKSILSASYRPARPFRIATSGEDLGVKFHEGPPFKYKHGSTKHERYPNRVQYNKDGSRFISVGSDNKIFVYEGKEGEFEKEIESKDNGHKGAIYGFCWNPDGTKILTASADKTAKIWNVESGEVETTFTVSKKPQVDDMQMSALWWGDYIITLSLSGALNYWDPASPDAPSKIIHGHNGPVTCSAASTKTGKYYTGDGAGKVTAWNDGEGVWLQGKGHGKGITCLAVSADGDLVYSGGRDANIFVNEASSGEFSSNPLSVGGAPAAVATSTVDNGLAVAVISKGIIVVLRNGEVVSSTDVSYKPTCVAISPNDKEIMVGGKDKKVYFYELSGSKISETRNYAHHEKAVTQVGYKADGSLTVSSGADLRILLCDGEGNIQNKTQWANHSSTVNDVRFNPACNRLLSVGNDLSIILWRDLETFKSARKTINKNAQKDTIDACNWIGDDTFITCAGDGTVKVWKAVEA